MKDKELYELKEDWKKCALEYRKLAELLTKENMLMSSFLDKIADTYSETDPAITEFLENRGLEWERIRNIIKEIKEEER